MSGTTSSGWLAIALGVVVAVAGFVPLVAVAYRRSGRLSPLRLLGWVALCVYAVALWTYTLVPVPASSDYACVSAQLNLTESFADVGKYDLSSPRAILTNPAVVQFVFNLALFVPLGFLLRTMYRRGILVATAVGFVVSLLIELTQLTGVWGIFPCAYRLFDFSDLIMNTAGAALGSLVAIAFTRRRHPRTDAAQRLTAGRRLLGMLCDVLFLVVTGSVLGVLWRLALLAFAGGAADDDWMPLETFLVSWAPLLAQLAVVLATGSTIGEHAVLLRPGRQRMSPLLTRAVRFVAGIGGYGILTAVEFPLSGLLLAAFVIASIVMVFTTREHRGLSYAASAAELSDARG